MCIRDSSEAVREFSFMPDTRCDTPEEFEEALLKYAAENNRNISISRRGMSPDFFLDGIEYHAYRTSGRWGIVVHCEMKNPTDYVPKEMSSKKYKLYRIISVAALPLLIFLISNLYPVSYTHLDVYKRQMKTCCCLASRCL